MDNNYLLSLFFFLGLFPTPQGLSAQEKSENFSLKPYFTFLDTVDKDGKDPYIKVKWLDTILSLRISQSEVRQKIEMDKYRQFYEKKGEVMDTQAFKAISMAGAQNCHSYALERYFANWNFEDNLVFTPKTSLFNGEMAKVLEVAFKRIQRIKPKALQKNKIKLPHKILLVFRDKNDSPIHTVFYNQVFQSKNGVFRPYDFKSIKPLLKSYFDTVWIDHVELDGTKFSTYKMNKNE